MAGECSCEKRITSYAGLITNDADHDAVPSVWSR